MISKHMCRVASLLFLAKTSFGGSNWRYTCLYELLFASRSWRHKRLIPAAVFGFGKVKSALEQISIVSDQVQRSLVVVDRRRCGGSVYPFPSADGSNDNLSKMWGRDGSLPSQMARTTSLSSGVSMPGLSAPGPRVCPVPTPDFSICSLSLLSDGKSGSTN